MSKIKYFLNGDRFTALECVGKKTDGLEIDLGCNINGTLIADSYSAELTDGKCVLNLCRMPDGAYAPYIISDGRHIRADGFEKRDGAVCLPPLGDKELRRLMKKQLDCEERIKSLENSTRAMSDKISHTTIF